MQGPLSHIVYDTAAKTNIDLIEKTQRQILRAIFFKNYTVNLSTILTKYKILAASEFYISELFREVFLRLRGISPLNIVLLSLVVGYV